MAIESSPVAIQANNYSAELFRRGTMGAFLQRGTTIGSVVGGIIGAGDFTTTYGGSGLGVTTSAGEAFVNGTSSTTQSGYYIRGTSATANTPAAANPSNPRIDLIYLQINDAAYSGVANSGTCSIATGTPTSGASLTNLSGAPSVPTSSLALAYILIPANASTITNSDISNVATFVRPSLPELVPKGLSTNYTLVANDLYVPNTTGLTGTLPVPTQGLMVGVFNIGGTAALPTTITASSGDIFGLGANGVASIVLGAPNAFVVLVGTGTNWLVVSGQQDSGWLTPSLGNSWTAAGSLNAPQYRIIGNRVQFRGAYTPGGSSGTSPFTIPAGYRPVATGGWNGPLAGAGDTTHTVVGQVLVNGTVTIWYTSGATNLSQDNISYTVD